MAEDNQRYSEEDVQEILERAMGVQMKGDYTRKQLEDMAAELGIDTEALVVAEQSWLAEREAVHAREEFLAHRRQEFLQHLVPYILVIGMLFVINVMTSPGFLWFLFPALGWGIGLGTHAWQVFGVTEGPEFERKLEEWKRKHGYELEEERQDHLPSPWRH